MARLKTMKAIDTKIADAEDKLRKLKEKCDQISSDLDQLYEEKHAIERAELLTAIENSSRTRAEIMAFLEC